MVLQEWWWCYFCNFLVFKICFLVAKSGIFVHVQAGILFSLVVARIMQCLVIKLSLVFSSYFLLLFSLSWSRTWMKFYF